jgi:hypothetical protein
MRIAYTTFVLALVLLGCKGREPEQQIIFAAKSFYDNGKTTDSGIVYIAGTLTGEDLGYKNNTTAVVCYADRMECRKSETAVWVTEPINQSRAQCKNSNTKILKWSIEDSPAWKAMFHKDAAQ